MGGLTPSRGSICHLLPPSCECKRETGPSSPGAESTRLSSGAGNQPSGPCSHKATGKGSKWLNEPLQNSVPTFSLSHGYGEWQAAGKGAKSTGHISADKSCSYGSTTNLMLLCSCTTFLPAVSWKWEGWTRWSQRSPSSWILKLQNWKEPDLSVILHIFFSSLQKPLAIGNSSMSALNPLGAPHICSLNSQAAITWHIHDRFSFGRGVTKKNSFFGCAGWLVGISVPQPVTEPRPWQWKPAILTTRPTGNSL